MKIKTLALCFLTLFLCISLADCKANQNLSYNDFIKSSGKSLRTKYGKGEEIFLRGVNAGGLMIQEFWMCLTENTKNVSCHSELLDILNKRFGSEKTKELERFYQDNYWTLQDFDNCSRLGFNCIRLPIWYKNIVKEDGTLKEDAWDKLDWFVQNAGARGIYVIIDMHGAPGSQNGSDHSGVDGKENKEKASQFFWGENAKENQELFYYIWEQIALHFKGNPVVVGYDLLNEPFCTYRYNSSYSEKYLHNLLWNIYDIAYKRIRAIDNDHIVIMEATWDASDLPNPDDFGWENVMYEYHNYLYDDYFNKQGKQISNMKKKIRGINARNYNVPSLLGEFNYMSENKTWEEGLKLLDESKLNWTMWTYKTSVNNGNWGLFHHTAMNKVNIETDSFEDIKRKWTNVQTTSENTELTKVFLQHLQ